MESLAFFSLEPFHWLPGSVGARLALFLHLGIISENWLDFLASAPQSFPEAPFLLPAPRSQRPIHNLPQSPKRSAGRAGKGCWLRT